jgi:hypothetical protein
MKDQGIPLWVEHQHENKNGVFGHKHPKAMFHTKPSTIAAHKQTIIKERKRG